MYERYVRPMCWRQAVVPGARKTCSCDAVGGTTGEKDRFDVAGRGSLERAVLTAMWDADRPLLVREMLDRLDVDRPLAYTTVQTVADRLTRKGMLTRTREGRAYRYEPTRRREEHLVAVMLEALGQTPDRELVLIRFAQSVDHEDARRLLAALVDTLAREGE